MAWRSATGTRFRLLPVHMMSERAALLLALKGWIWREKLKHASMYENDVMPLFS